MHGMQWKQMKKKYIKSINRQRISKILSLVLYNFYLSSLGSLENCNWELRLKFLTNILLKIEFLNKNSIKLHKPSLTVFYFC